MDKFGLVSIITPTYNSSRFIKSTYESIVKQSYKNWEWLVTDDCSTDDTMSILSQLSAEDSRVRVFSLNINSGAAIARNNSLDHVRGDFAAFLDSDDLWLPGKLVRQLSFMGDTIDFSFTAYEQANVQGHPTGLKIDSKNKGSFNFQDMLKKRATLGCSTVILKSDLVSSLRMRDIRTGQDYAFWLDLLKMGHRAHLLPDVLTHYRIVPNSISRNKLKKAKRQWFIYRRVHNIPFPISVFYFINYAWRAVLKR
ncbi:glycosyl transferase family 2 [Kineobactrum sediminis]|uniref:Glycosyl transferase family 2 n=1 Tax=Kineobactrum sediminis TaxID=1905677 RepID=A0A2N5Y113_9GAMM|nr:glycosyltransferase family 2 protein [Kineobactrum sediminis]PLW82080.1 glycosyl transferase family 2 [Kineobactrum sediminis]